MSDDVVVFQKPDLPMVAFPAMEEIRRQGKLCDVTLRVGDNKFSAHRIVLAASIPYFHAMFTHDMVESKKNEITMQGIEPGALEALVNFAYNGRVQLDTTNVQSLLIGASFLHLQVVKEACCDFLKNRLHPHNVLGVRSFAEQFVCTTLVEAANKYINKHFVDVSKSDEFLALPYRDVSDLLQRDELHINSEELVFEAALAWVRKNLTERKEIMEELLVRVRLPLLTPEYLADKVGQEELIKNSLKCRDLVDEAKDYHLLPNRRQKLQTFKTRPRSCSEIVGVIFAVGGLTSSGDSVSTVERCDPAAGRWELAEPMTTLRSRVGVAVLKGRLYAIGGYDGTERLSTVEIFNPETKKWKLVAPMQCKRSALGAVSLEDKLYVCGGFDGLTSLSSVEYYEPELDKWTMAPHMMCHRSAAAMAVLDGQIYALGGHDGLSIFDSVECYNNHTETWTMVAPLLTKRCRLGAAALNRKLYACGGYDGSVFLRTVECYDPISNQWTYVRPMHIKRSRMALVSNCGKLYAIGGYDGLTNLSSMEVYYPETDTWTFGASMCAHEGGVGVGVLSLEPTV